MGGFQGEIPRFGPKVDSQDRYHVSVPRLVPKVVSLGLVRSRMDPKVWSQGWPARLVSSLGPKVGPQCCVLWLGKVSTLVFKLRGWVLWFGRKFGSQGCVPSWGNKIRSQVKVS